MAQFCNKKWDKVSQAYVTLLSTSNYLEGVLVLHESLKQVKSTRPLLVLITEEIATPEILAIFQEEGIFYEIVDTVSYAGVTQDKYSGCSVLNTASKVHLFRQKNWDKLVYIDADTMVLQNIDDLFVRFDGSMVKEPADTMGFTGLFVIEPLQHDEDDFLFHLVMNTACFDGDLIGKLWFHVRTNPDYQIPFCYLHMPHHYDKTSKVIHYCNPGKPWMNEVYDEGTFLSWKYNSFLQKVREKYNTAHYSLG